MSVGGSMADFREQDDYEERVYSKGAAALLAAREAAGEEEFDRAVRCYVESSAWTIATPADLARALADRPEHWTCASRRPVIRRVSTGR